MTDLIVDIASHERLLCCRARGCLDPAGIGEFEARFWAARTPEHDRLLMDFRAITHVAMPVREFIARGLAGKTRHPRPDESVRAAYVATRPAVFGYIRVIEGVWSGTLSVQSFQRLEEAMAWLELPPWSLEACRPVGD